MVDQQLGKKRKAERKNHFAMGFFALEFAILERITRVIDKTTRLASRSQLKKEKNKREMES